jgi:hypothetical protein
MDTPRHLDSRYAFIYGIETSHEVREKALGMFEAYCRGKRMVLTGSVLSDGGSIPTISCVVRGSHGLYPVYIGDGMRGEPTVTDAGHQGDRDLMCSHKLFALMVAVKEGFLNRKDLAKVVEVLRIASMNMITKKGVEQ